jgi:hypothetical protein
LRIRTNLRRGSAELPHLFERFYRADKSRADADGASAIRTISTLGPGVPSGLVESALSIRRRISPALRSWE